jgi:deoxyribose-phosphate aldolase
MNTAARLLAALDHTGLNADDTPESIRRLCIDAARGPGRPAAVCVYPVHAVTARAALDGAGAPEIAVAAVANFPDGGEDPARAVADIQQALAASATEIDLVFPWRAYIAGNCAAGVRMLARCREATAGKLLKVIIETGELHDPHRIRELSALALDAGADFIKTSTGKTATGATPESARTILEYIRERGRGGLKVSGGIRSVVDATRYLDQADEILGDAWATPVTFRIGASSLLGSLRD